MLFLWILIIILSIIALTCFLFLIWMNLHNMYSFSQIKAYFKKIKSLEVIKTMKQITMTKTIYKIEKNDLLEFRVFLARKNLTQNEFAKKAGITPSYLCMILKGKRELTTRIISKFKKAGFSLSK